MKFIAAILSLMLISLSLAPPAAAQKHRPESDAVRQFAQKFYDWYARAANEESRDASWDVAVTSKSDEFTSNLARTIRNVWAKQSSGNGDYVGLDFDPFLNTQDPEQRYKVGKVTKEGNAFFVEVHGIFQGKLQSEVSVVAVVIKVKGQYRFADFRYPNFKGDLLDMLNKAN